ncbi:hypothetical protein PTTG_26242 [Puccinia triticina 1-1 BBBD Race 1]|uniref:Uncharacterized protein n=1 Tax=Puccinia triticina (isolate 1-1 / race 1 (BBBD)) TaxID=630390 RepID=A0A180GWL8_PUCT1|nr:hypothetical protein PTTG_26242 [Puccinia triticina 1-1 BBBD Race 1]
MTRATLHSLNIQAKQATSIRGNESKPHNPLGTETRPRQTRWAERPHHYSQKELLRHRIDHIHKPNKNKLIEREQSFLSTAQIIH